MVPPMSASFKAILGPNQALTNPRLEAAHKSTQKGFAVGRVVKTVCIGGLQWLHV